MSKCLYHFVSYEIQAPLLATVDWTRSHKLGIQADTSAAATARATIDIPSIIATAGTNGDNQVAIAEFHANPNGKIVPATLRKPPLAKKSLDSRRTPHIWGQGHLKPPPPKSPERNRRRRGTTKKPNTTLFQRQSNLRKLALQLWSSLPLTTSHLSRRRLGGERPGSGFGRRSRERSHGGKHTTRVV
jgi:hypothetical protein